MIRELKPRHEMDSRYTWDLTAIFESMEAFEAAFAEAAQLMDSLKKWQGRVAEDPRAAIREHSSLYEKVSRIVTYAGLYRDEDNGDPARQALSDRVNRLMVSARSSAAFLDPELLMLPDETLEEMQNDASFSDFSEMIRQLRRQKSHVLPAEQEALLAAMGEVRGAANDIFGKFNNVDLPLPLVPDEEGNMIQLTHGNMGPLLRSRNRDVRKAALEGMNGTFGKFRSTVSAIYAASVKGDVFSSRARKYESARQASLSPLEIPEAVYDNLINEVENALPAMDEYLKIRKKYLGVNELHLYDLYVPMISDFDMKLSFDEACDLVCEGLSVLGEDYVGTLREAFKNGWIDVYENKGKRSGAYSWGCYGVHPYVLLNHSDDLGGAMTLAHELGHAMHSYHSNKAQCFEKADYSLFVAEVASTCNEVLLMHHLLNKFKGNKAAEAFLLNQLLEEFRTTVFRQTMFATFEKESHAMYERGEAITGDVLCNIYLDLNKKYYGRECVVDPVIENEWMRIPHFYRNFYVYQYATGFSAAVAIANRILKLGAPAVEDYKKFLSAGSSVPPIEALKYAGVDMSKPTAVQEAMQVFADTVKQLQAMNA
ncbi:MAG: oligoendopeptidase F [Clostridia bacterium]|nr:oligoendopeptidase F [Clostridia bacterium]